MGSPTIVIPARSGSKGWPRKNVSLFDHTASIIPKKYGDNVIVTTDDETVTGLAESYNFKTLQRPERFSKDSADIKGVVKHVMQSTGYKPTDTVIMLYLTYPERTWNQVETMYNEFVSTNSRSMLCRQPVKTHPCLTMFDNGSGKGTPVIDHQLYQRQQYPECFEISHYICMFRAGELNKLNKNMYNENTTFHSINRVVDVDHEKDYKVYLNTI